MTITVAGHTAETNADRIVRELIASHLPSPHRVLSDKILSTHPGLHGRLIGRTHQIDQGINLWYTLPENSLTGEAQLRRLFIRPLECVVGPARSRSPTGPTSMPTLTRLVAAWRA